MKKFAKKFLSVFLALMMVLPSMAVLEAISPSQTITAQAATKAKVTVAAPKSLSVKAKASNSLDVSFKKVSKANGYVIYYSTSKKFTKKTTKKVTVKVTKKLAKKKTVTKRISKLKNNKKYYIRVRAYRTVNKKKVYSKYTKTKAVKAKKITKAAAATTQPATQQAAEPTTQAPAQQEQPATTQPVTETPTQKVDNPYTVEPVQEQYYSVTFETNCDAEVKSVSVKSGELINKPTDPIRNGYTFAGWYIDSDLVNLYDFSTPVTDNLKLYAKWDRFAILSCDTSTLKYETSQDVTFYLECKESISSIELRDSDNAVVATLVDDGLYSSSGDELTNDGIFTGIANISAADKELTFVAYFYINSTEFVSNQITIPIYKPLSDEDNEKMISLQNSLSDYLTNDQNESISLEEKTNDVIEILENDDCVNYDSITTSESMIYFEYTTGIVGGIELEKQDEYISQSNSCINETESFDYNYSESNDFINSSESYINDSISEVSQISTSDINTTILYALDDNKTSRHKAFENIKSSWETDYNMNVNFNDNVTVNGLASELNDQNIIIFQCHGNYNYNNTPILCLKEKVSKLRNKKYEDDLNLKNVFQVTTSDGDCCYWIAPSFFSTHYSNNGLENSFIFLGNCCGLGQGNDDKPSLNLSLSNAFKNCGSSALIGFYNSVFTSYACDVMETMVEKLMNGETVYNSLESAKKAYGNNDRDYGMNMVYEGAWELDDVDNKIKNHGISIPFITFGNDFRLIYDGLQNGSFEESSTPYKWDSNGDVRILEQLAELKPTQGDKMCIITTGIGSGEGASKSIVSQKFIVPENISNISFDYDVVSEEPMEYVGSQYNDVFVAKLLDSEGNEIIQLALETVNSSTWYDIDGIDFEGGDSTTYHTKWKSVTTNDNILENYRGETVTVVFEVYDVGDSIYDTAVLIDNVSLH